MPSGASTTPDKLVVVPGAQVVCLRQRPLQAPASTALPPHELGWKAPHDWPVGHVPQLTLPPQPSPTKPQLAFTWAHVLGMQDGAPQCPATPAPPQVCPPTQVPQVTVPPQPSATIPQLAIPARGRGGKWRARTYASAYVGDPSPSARLVAGAHAAIDEPATAVGKGAAVGRDVRTLAPHALGGATTLAGNAAAATRRGSYESTIVDTAATIGDGTALARARRSLRHRRARRTRDASANVGNRDAATSPDAHPAQSTTPPQPSASFPHLPEHTAEASNGVHPAVPPHWLGAPPPPHVSGAWHPPQSYEAPHPSHEPTNARAYGRLVERAARRARRCPAYVGHLVRTADLPRSADIAVDHAPASVGHFPHLPAQSAKPWAGTHDWVLPQWLGTPPPPHTPLPHAPQSFDCRNRHRPDRTRATAQRKFCDTRHHAAIRRRATREGRRRSEHRRRRTTLPFHIPRNRAGHRSRRRPDHTCRRRPLGASAARSHCWHIGSPVHWRRTIDHSGNRRNQWCCRIHRPRVHSRSPGRGTSSGCRPNRDRHPLRRRRPHTGWGPLHRHRWPVAHTRLPHEMRPPQPSPIGPQLAFARSQVSGSQMELPASEARPSPPHWLKTPAPPQVAGAVHAPH